jgi:N-acetylmuramoyl-L-alanine amidase
MKEIKICIHCSATPTGSRLTFEQCKKMHIEQNGWRDIGYNLYIERDGAIHQGRPFGEELAHAKGHNTGFLAICYEGGLDANSKPEDTRTDAQKQSLIISMSFIKKIYRVTDIDGHRDLSPDINHDGVITPDEWLKSCPCFNVKTEMSGLLSSP